MRKSASSRRSKSSRLPVVAESCEPRTLLSSIASDQTVTGTIAAPNQVDSYTFTAAAGASVYAAAADTAAGSPLTVFLVLRSPTGTIVTQSAGAPGTAILAQNLAQAGTYTLTITGSGGTVGPYAATLGLTGVAPATGTDAGPIDSGAYHTASISTGDVDVYTISGTAGGSLLTTIAPLTPVSGFQTQAIIFSPTGALVGNVASAAGTVSLVQNLPATGTYYVFAVDQGGDQTGDYGISIGTFGGTQVTDADSGPINSGERRTGTLDPGDFDVYTISANSGGSFLSAIGTSPPASGFQTQLLVFSPTGALLGNVASAAGTNSLIQNLAATGTYYFVALDQGGDHVGSYTISVARFGGSQTVSPGDEGGAIASGEYRTGAITPGDFDVYTFSASTGQTLVAALGDLDPSGDYNPQLIIFTPTGALLANAAGAVGASTVQTNLEATGTYYVVALDQGGDTAGAYGLTVMKVGAGATQTTPPGDEGGPLTSGQRVTGIIAPGDIDSFTFNLTAGEGALWTVGATTENTFSPHLIILDPSGTSAFNSISTQGRAYALPATGAMAGTYTALVLDGSGGASGEYALTGVAGAAAPFTDDDSGALTPGQPRAGSLPPGDADVFTAAAAAGQPLTINVAKTSTGTFTPDLIVYDPTGAYVQANAGSTNAHVTINSPVTGTYTVVVYDQIGAGSGAYSIALNTPAGTDNFPPKLLEAAYRYNDRPAVLRLEFSEDVSASFQPDQFMLKNLTTNQSIDPADLSITFTHVADEIYFAFNGLPDGVLPNGNYRLTIPAADLTDVAGNPLTQDVSLDFFVLAGDLNRDRTVGFADLLTLAQNYGGTGKTFTQGDINYDGSVNFTDLLTLAQNYSTVLPAPAAAASAPTAPATPLLRKGRPRLSIASVPIK